jgi:hypothetical protein
MPGAVVMLGGSGFGDKLKKKKDEEGEDMGDKPAEEMAVEALFKAMKAGKPKAGVEALKAFYDACYGDPVDDEESDSDKESDEY